MSCEMLSKRMDVLEDYSSGALATPQREEVRAHVQACAACRMALEEAAASGNLLRAAYVPAAAPGGAFWTRLRARLVEQEALLAQAGDFWATFERLAWRLSFGAATLAVLLLGIVIGTQLPRGSGKEMQAESREIFQEPVRQPASADDVLVELAAERTQLPQGR